LGTVTVTTQKSKLDMLAEQEARLSEEVEAARARIAEYPALLHDARSRAVYAKPNVRPGAELNGEVAKLTAKEKKDLASLRSLEQDLSAIRSVLAVEAQRETEKTTEAARAQLAGLHEQEREIWSNAGKLLAELVGIWNSYTEQVEQSHRVASANRLENSDALAVTPGPRSFREFLDLLLTAATSEEVRAASVTEQLADIGVFGRRDDQGNDIGGAEYDVRPAGSRQVEVRRRLDERDVLYHAVPDLRAVVRALQLS
jgi:hypothetical protein